MSEEFIQYRVKKSLSDPWARYTTMIEASASVPESELSRPGAGCAIGFDLTVIHLQSVFNSGVDRRALYESITHGSLVSSISNPNGSLKAIGPWGEPVNADVVVLDNIGIVSNPQGVQQVAKPCIIDAVLSFGGSCGHLLCPVNNRAACGDVAELLSDIGMVEVAPGLLGLSLDYVFLHSV